MAIPGHSCSCPAGARALLSGILADNPVTLPSVQMWEEQAHSSPLRAPGSPNTRVRLQ